MIRKDVDKLTRLNLRPYLVLVLFANPCRHDALLALAHFLPPPPLPLLLPHPMLISKKANGDLSRRPIRSSDERQPASMRLLTI